MSQQSEGVFQVGQTSIPPTDPSQMTVSGYQSHSGPTQSSSNRSLSSSRIQNKLSFLREETKRNKEARRVLEPLNESLNETLRGFEKIVSLSTQQDVGEEKKRKETKRQGECSNHSMKVSTKH